MNTQMHNCPFCSDNRKSFLRENHYEVDKAYFYEDEYFSISPDISPLVLGHLLVIPSTHYSCFGEITNEKMLSKIKDVTEWLLGTSDLFCFEHGAVVEGKGGASINHAHLHVMPRPRDLDENTIDKFLKKEGCIYSKKMHAQHGVLHDCFLKNQPYIYYKINGNNFVYPVDNPPHQLLRMLLQPYCNISYNWKKVYKSIESIRNYLNTIDYIYRIHPNSLEFNKSIIL